MSNSERLYEVSQALIPGGVNSPVRAFKGVGGNPIFFKQGKGAYLIDVDNRHYIDYVSSWGALILGHCYPEIVQTIHEIAQTGTSFGAPTQLEVQLAEKIVSLMPAIEKIRMVNSGTEATMTAIRLARGFTGRDKVIKFNGCYHGHSDSLLAKAGSGLFTLGIPSSPGVPASIAEHTLTADYNNLDQVKTLFERYPEQIAAVILEPVAGNMGFVQPQTNFLKGLRDLCNAHGSVLIFDEVMTGFRVALGGAQALFHVKPDLTTLGKIIGGGLPVGAVGGRAEIMDCLAPLGCIYQAGTLSGNPLAMGAGLVTLNQLEKPGFYDRLSNVTHYLIEGLTGIARSFEIPFHATALGGMFGFNFTKKSQIIDHQDVTSSDEALFKRFFHGMLQKGIYFAPSMYEAGFVSGVHCQDEVNLTLEAAKSVFNTLVSKVKD